MDDEDEKEEPTPPNVVQVILLILGAVMTFSLFGWCGYMLAR